MKIISFILLLFFCNSSFSTTGFPGINIATSSYYSEEKKEYGLRLGSTHIEGMYLGSIYETSIENKNSNELEQKNLGLSAGFTEGGCYIIYHHFLKAKKNEDSVIEYKGSGYGFDFGWHFKISDYFSIGPQLSYRKFKFTESEQAGVNQEIGIEDSYYVPMLSIGISF